MPAETPVGLIGVGLMGEVYARRLLAAGFAVIGYDIDAAKAEALAALGGRAGSLAEIAQTCEPIVLAVFNTDQVADVVENALIPGATGGTSDFCWSVSKSSPWRRLREKSRLCTARRPSILTFTAAGRRS